MSCPYKETWPQEKTTCRVASALARVETTHDQCVVTPEACLFCDGLSNPRSPNHVTYSLAISHLHQKNRLNLDGEHAYLRQGLAGNVPKDGPGTKLHSLIGWLKTDGACDCEAHKQMMNLWGVQGCLERVGEIEKWLETEAKRRGINWLPMTYRPLIKYAIKLAGHGKNETV